MKSTFDDWAKKYIKGYDKENLTYRTQARSLDTPLRPRCVTGYDRAGRPQVVLHSLHNGKKRINAVYENAPVKKKKHSNSMKEHRDFMENLMEYEASGKHPNVTPQESKRAKKRLKRFVDNGRPLQGVDV